VIKEVYQTYYNILSFNIFAQFTFYQFLLEFFHKNAQTFKLLSGLVNF
jgi:hypothetical protein